MWTAEEHIEVHASPERIWALFSDVAGWRRWNAGIEHIQLHGPFVQGARFSMQPPGEAAFTSTLVEVKANECFTDETLVGETRVRVDHRIFRLSADGCKVVYRTEVSGPDAARLGAAITADFPDVLAALKNLAESNPPRFGPGSAPSPPVGGQA